VVVEVVLLEDGVYVAVNETFEGVVIGVNDETHGKLVLIVFG
jgi:hypothetical protein